MNSLRIYVLLAVLPLFLSIALACSKHEAAPDLIRPVRALRVAPVNGKETLVQTGDIQARRETDLSFQIGGRVARRMVEIGTTVSKGQVLAILDSSIVNNELRAAEADLASASSAFELADASQARVKQLLAGQSASRQQMDEATAHLRAASARRDAAEVACDIGRKKLSYTRLLAEEAGVVVAVGANQGQIVGPGQMIARVATHERDAVFSVTEQLIMIASPDIKVRVSLAANPDIFVIGTVHELSPTADPVTRTYRVRIALPDPPQDMSIGATVIGKIDLPTGTAVVLPSAALTSEDGTPAVYLVEPATKTVQRRKVTVARVENDRVFIASGLKAGELVVIAGVTKLRPGQVVALPAADGDAQ
jgi:RND family efflux transporter MFP subunit